MILNSISNLLLTHNDVGSIFRETFFGFLDPSELLVISQVCSSVESVPELGMAWKQIERFLGYPVDVEKGSFRNYNDFIKDLVVRIQSYPEDQVPSDIRAILAVLMERAPSIKQACKLQEFIRARDTLVVWSSITEQLDAGGEVLTSLDSGDAFIQKSKEFAGWMEANHELLKGLKFLRLCQKQLTTVPRELGQLSSLKGLTINQNQLASIPRELGNLLNLRSLNLGYNQLKSVPEELGQLSNLTWLLLHQNQLTRIPREIGQLSSLQRFLLKRNQLASIPEELGNLPHLRRLDLSFNQLASIPEGLEGRRGINLAGNPLTSDPEDRSGSLSTS